MTVYLGNSSSVWKFLTLESYKERVSRVQFMPPSPLHPLRVPASSLQCHGNIPVSLQTSILAPHCMLTKAAAGISLEQRSPHGIPLSKAHPAHSPGRSVVSWIPCSVSCLCALHMPWGNHTGLCALSETLRVVQTLCTLRMLFFLWGPIPTRELQT